MRWLLFIIPFCLMCCQPVLAEDGVDYLSLATMLIKDGNYPRAEKTLAKIESPEDDQLAVIDSLWGMVLLNKKKYAQALEKFQKALKQGLNEPELYLYQAESLLRLNRLPEASESLKKFPVEQKQKLPFFLVQSEIFWSMGKKAQAWEQINQAMELGLSQSVLVKKKFYYLIEEGLYQSAQSLAFKQLNNPNNFNDVLAMASTLRQKGQLDVALPLLQALLTQRPGKELVALAIAQCYLAKGETYSAALVLEESTKHNSSLGYEAGELLRQVGKSYRARFLNLSNTDPQKQLKQKLVLYLEDDDYHSLKFMIPQLRKHQLLEDQEIRYAVAYSLYRTGDLAKSESYLQSIDQDGLFEKSIELKKEIGECRKEKWACSDTI